MRVWYESWKTAQTRNQWESNHRFDKRPKINLHSPLLECLGHDPICIYTVYRYIYTHNSNNYNYGFFSFISFVYAECTPLGRGTFDSHGCLSSSPMVVSFRSLGYLSQDHSFSWWICKKFITQIQQMIKILVGYFLYWGFRMYRSHW